MTTRRWTRAVITAALAVTLAGCADDTKPESNAVELPPAASMAMNLGFFAEGQQAGGVQDAAGVKLNYLNAAVRAAFINVTVVTVLTPPQLAFAAAIHTLPSLQEDGSYLWIYTWRDGGEDYQIRLSGTPAGNHVDWELYAVLPGADPELWFYGQSHRQNDEGYWVFSDFTAPGDPEVLRVDWSVTGQNASLDLENIHSGHEEEGDRLQYEVLGSAGSITFADASEVAEWDIQWNEATGTGSLRVPDYNDGNRACWDENQEDVECPAS